MAISGNLVFQFTTGTGTGNLTLQSMTADTPPQYFRNCYDVFVSVSFKYCLRHRTAAEWEVGVGHMTDATTFVRDSVEESSNANALVNFSAGIKDVISDIPASLQNLIESQLIRTDGTSTASAQIPLAQGVSLATTKSAYFGGTADNNSQGKISNSASSLLVTGLTDNALTNGASVTVTGGSALQNGNSGTGGYVYLVGGDYDHTGDLVQWGFAATGNTITSFTGSNNIGGSLTAGNDKADFAVGNNLYVAGMPIFAGGIGCGGKLPSAGYSILATGESAQIIGLDRKASGAGVGLTIQAGWAQNAASNTNAGNLVLAPGKATGTGTGNTQIQAVGGGGSGSTDQAAATVATFAIGTVTFADAYNFVFGTSTGTKFGTGTTQRIGFFNASPVVQPGATIEIGTVLSNLGLRTGGTAYPITTSGAISFTGTIGLGGAVTVTDAKDFAIGTTNGTKFGTGTTQKIGFWNATPIVQPANTVAIDTLLANTGLRASGGAANFATKLQIPSLAASTTEGDFWSDSTQKSLATFTDGIKAMLSGCVFTQTADKTVTNTVTETSLIGTGVGTMTLPANFFVAGKTIRLRIGGIYTTPAVATPSVVVKVKYGSTVIATVTTTSLLSGATNLEFDGEILITCRTTGGSGSVMCHGDIEYSTGLAGTIAVDPLNNAGAATTIDTTGANALDVTITWDSATATRSVKSTVTTVEILN